MLSFHIKFVQTETDRQTTVKQYAPDLSIQGHKNSNSFCDVYKTLWEKEKMLVTSISHFPSIVSMDFFLCQICQVTVK